jgi:5'-phosphate synthase pdxT subunit
MRIGVLALQGCVLPHRPHIEALGAKFVEVRSPSDLDLCDGLILPGGESTTQLKLHKKFGFEEALLHFAGSKPIWGICAGAILMAQEVSNPDQFSYKIFPIRARRNAYGRQLDSFEFTIQGHPTAFIRAPLLEPLDSEVVVLESHNNIPVWMSWQHHVVSSCHPELSTSYPHPMHAYFVERVASASASAFSALPRISSSL